MRVRWLRFAKFGLLAGMLFVVYHFMSDSENGVKMSDAVAARLSGGIALLVRKEFSSRKNQYIRSTTELEPYLKQRAVHVKEVDCSKVFLGDSQELQKALLQETQWSVAERLPTDVQVHREASHCQQFLQNHGFIMDSLTEMELHFPIAYSILTFKNASQVVDLLSAVYRPQNVYCLHVDKSCHADFHVAMESVARCLPNVFLASRFVDVRWGGFTVLEPELVCMEDLWKRTNKTWKYFINLTGQEFPLKTNYELVQILTAFRGANDIAARVPNDRAIKRWAQFLPAPHQIKLFKGAAHIVASRGYVDFVLHAPQAQDFLQWCKPTSHTSEHFFNSLNYNPHLHVPGQYLGNATKYDPKEKSFVRYKNWVPKYPCPGHKVVRAICILNVLDLPVLYRRPEMFANKFHADYSRLALRCLAEEIFNRTRDQSLGVWKEGDFNVTLYQQFAMERDKSS